MYNNELMHFGIKGQRWGVRRYQNEDGSYTSAGKKRYGKLSEEQYQKADKVRKRLVKERDKLYDHKTEMYKSESDFYKKNPNPTYEQSSEFYRSKRYQNETERWDHLSDEARRLDRNYVKDQTKNDLMYGLVLSGIATATVAAVQHSKAKKRGESISKKALAKIGLTAGISTAITIADTVQSNIQAKKRQQDAYKRYGIID